MLEPTFNLALGDGCSHDAWAAVRTGALARRIAGLVTEVARGACVVRLGVSLRRRASGVARCRQCRVYELAFDGVESNGEDGGDRPRRQRPDVEGRPGSKLMETLREYQYGVTAIWRRAVFVRDLPHLRRAGMAGLPAPQSDEKELLVELQHYDRSTSSWLAGRVHRRARWDRAQDRAGRVSWSRRPVSIRLMLRQVHAVSSRWFSSV